MALKETDMGVGYARNEFADTTAPRAELERLARLVRMGPAGDAPYRYRSPEAKHKPDEDESHFRPCNYPPSLDDVLRGDLRQCRTWDQARAVVEMKAVQISQTGYKAEGRKADADEREWAHMTYAGSRAKQQLERVPGTCKGCNADPCRCLA